MTITIETKTVTVTTTDGDRTTVVIAIAMIRQTTIMTGMTTIGMTDMIRGIHVMIGEPLTEVRATIEGITTTVVGILLKMTRATQTCPRPTHQHTRPGINLTLPLTQIGGILVTGPQ